MTADAGNAPPPAAPEQSSETEAPDAQQTPDIEAAVKAATRKANKEAETLRLKLQEFEDRDKTEAQRLAERAEAAEQRANTAERAAVRLQVITESGLPANLHRFVVGNDEDELRDAATALKAEIAASLSSENRSVDVGLGPRGTAPSKDINAQLRRAAGRS